MNMLAPIAWRALTVHMCLCRQNTAAAQKARCATHGDADTEVEAVNFPSQESARHWFPNVQRTHVC